MADVAESNLELARRGYEAMLRGDLEAVREILHPRVKWHGGDPHAEGACRDRSQAIAYMRDARARRPIAELVDLVDAGDCVVAVLRPDADRPATLSASLARFEDGKVVELIHYEDADEALAAAGVPSRT
jgi:ketosteroid isomerase-like protein